MKRRPSKNELDVLVKWGHDRSRGYWVRSCVPEQMVFIDHLPKRAMAVMITVCLRKIALAYRFLDGDLRFWTHHVKRQKL